MKNRFLGMTLKFLIKLLYGIGPEILISNKSPDNTDGVSQRTTLEDYWTKLHNNLT